MNMDTPDHQKLPSSGGQVGSAGKKFRDTQADLIKKGQYRKAFEMGMQEVRQYAGGAKNEDLLRRLAKYATKQGLFK
jgi:hypothetical protein